jgi:hypothetical protein
MPNNNERKSKMHPSNYGWPTTRTFPRTTREAFKDDIENAQWWYPPEQRWQDRLLFWLSVALWIVICVYLWKTR